MDDEILNSVYANFENKKKLQKEEDEREKEMCNGLIEQIKNEADKTLASNIQLLNKYMTPAGEAFLSKKTKGREEIRNALLKQIEQLEKRVEAQENIQFMKSCAIFKYNLIDINQIYYNSFEYMYYLMFK